MSEILETSMLVCFGFSWPLSVVKNIKSKTAKSMSLPFILLIIFGYIAGISAKFISGSVNYVLVVYLVNLFFVSANLAVYFINRSKDKKYLVEMGKIGMSEKNCEVFENTKKRYDAMNNIAQKRGTVFFGSDLFCRLDINELAVSFNLSETLYNRSVEGMSVKDAAAMLDTCVLDLAPEKVFIEFGKSDIADMQNNISDILEKFEWLLYTIHTKTKARIIVVYSAGKKYGNKEIMKKLKGLTADSGCEFVDMSENYTNSGQELKIFEQLRFYIRSGKISFIDAMNMVNV